VNLGDGPFSVINPEITWRSAETFTMWDDCMSFPDLLVRVQRHESISMRYLDEQGRTREWDRMPRAAAELLQHETDHLDGVLAVDRAMDRESIVHRKVYEAMPEHFRKQVDYVIGE
jgi:peptide deformylase